MLRGGQYSEHGAAFALAAKPPSSAKQPIAVLPQELQDAFAISVQSHGSVQSPDSIVEVVATIYLRTERCVRSLRLNTIVEMRRPRTRGSTVVNQRDYRDFST